MSKFNEKDIVYVTSDVDKTPMNIAKIYQPGQLGVLQDTIMYACLWLNKKKDTKEGTFPENVLALLD